MAIPFRQVFYRGVDIQLQPFVLEFWIKFCLKKG
jgi:hypothetical protein